MSNNANSAYPLLVNYKEESVEGRSRGVLVELDPATDKEFEEPYSLVGPFGSEWLHLQQCNIRRSLEYEIDFEDENETRKTQKVTENEWIFAKGEIEEKKSRWSAEKSTFSFLGSSRTTNELEVTIKPATLGSIEEYLDSAENAEVITNIKIDRDALRQRLQGKGFFRFWAIKEQGYDGTSYHETFGLDFYILPTHFKTIKKAFLTGNTVRVGVNLYLLPGVFWPVKYSHPWHEVGAADYKILDDVNDIQNKPPENMLAGPAVPPAYRIQCCNHLSVGFEFEFLISSREENKSEDDN